MLNLFSSHAEVLEARDLFESMPLHDLVSWNVMLAAFALNGHLQQAKSFFFNAMPCWDVVSWNSMLSAIIKHGNINNAKEWFELMLVRNLVSCNALLMAFSQAGHLFVEARELFSRMPEHDISSYNAMLAAHCHYGSKEEAYKLYDAMPECDLATLTILLSRHAQNGDLANAKAVFDSMPDQDLVSTTAMLAAYAQNGHLREAEELFVSMRYLSLVSWNSMLDGYAQTGSVMDAVLLFQKMPVKNLVSWNVMLAGYVGNLEASTRFFTGMGGRDAVSWNVLMAANTYHGQFMEALSLHLEMKVEGCDPDEATFTSLIFACSHLGSLSSARQCFASMLYDFKFRATKQHYHSIVDLLARLGFLHEACELIEVMPFMPIVDDWICLLSACRKYNMAELGAYAAERGIQLDDQRSAVYLLLEDTF